MLLIQFPHHRPRRRQRVPHKQEQTLVAREGDALSNDVGKLAERQVARNEELVLVDERDRLGGLGTPSFDNDGDSTRELFMDSATFLGPGRQRVGALKIHPYQFFLFWVRRRRRRPPICLEWVLFRVLIDHLSTYFLMEAALPSFPSTDPVTRCLAFKR